MACLVSWHLCFLVYYWLAASSLNDVVNPLCDRHSPIIFGQVMFSHGGLVESMGFIIEPRQFSVWGVVGGLWWKVLAYLASYKYKS